MKTKAISSLLFVWLTVTAGFGEVLHTLSSDGSVWRAESSDVEGTKSQIAMLPGTGYIDATADDYCLYGLRSDGAVYRSDADGNVSQVSLTGWDSSIKYINADSGTLYGMNDSNSVDVRDTDGTVAVHVGISSADWGDFTVTDDGRFWLLLTSGDDQAWTYAYTNGYSGALAGSVGFLNFSGSQDGFALASDGNEFFCAYDNSGVSTYIGRTSSDATGRAFFAQVGFGLGGMAVGSSLYTVETNGTLRAANLDTATKTTLGSLGRNVVGIVDSLKSKPMVELSVEQGSLETLAIGTRIFNDRDYVFYDLPEKFVGQPFVHSSINTTRVTCLNSGMIYAFTPDADQSLDSMEDELTDLGFEKTFTTPFLLFTVRDQVRLENTCSVFQKHVDAGETIRFGKWGVLVCSAMAPTNDPPVRVACVGDSITYGFGMDNPLEDSYPAQLSKILGKGYHVMNFGVSGATLLKNGDNPYWETSEFQPAHDFQPDMVVIMLGTNDLKPVNIGQIDSYVDDYIALINGFRELDSSPEVWVCYPPPSYRESDITDENIINCLIPKINEVACLAHVKKIDLHEVLTDKSALFPDGLHPNEDGATIMAETVHSSVLKKGVIRIFL